MKRAKLIPSILMLVLCTAVLAVGIYAASPTSHSIVGTVKITAGGANVSIAGYLDDGDSNTDDVKVTDTYTSRTSQTISIYANALDFDCSSASDIAEVAEKKLYFKVENHSGFSLGAYFLEGTVPESGTTMSNIAESKNFNGTMGSQTITNLITAKFTTYSEVPANGSTKMYSTLKLNQLNSEASTVTLNLNLNIEKFNEELVPVNVVEVKNFGAEITLESWIDGDDSTYQKHENVIVSQQFSYSLFAIDYANAQYLSDIPRQKLRIKITNHSDKELGAYFFDETSASEVPVQATHDNILREDEFKATIDGVETTVVGVDLTSYTHIGVASTNSSVITDEATLSIYFTPEAWAVEDANFIFNYKLVIEEYKPNVITTNIPTSSTTEGEATRASNFIKLSSTVNGSNRTSITSSTGFGSMTSEDLIVVVPNNVTMLGYYSFSGCSGLSAVTLPNSLNEIEDDDIGGEFQNCSNLIMIEIPVGVNELPVDAFSGCTKLSLVNICHEYSFGSTGRCFSACVNLTRTEFLEYCTYISGRTFGGCGIEKIVIPACVTYVGYSVFRGCTNLKEVVIKQRTSNQTSLSIILPELFDGSSYTWTDGTSEVTEFVSSTERDMVYTRVG